MADETVGSFQLHFIAYELPDKRWDGFVTIDRFDHEIGDFRRLVDRRPVHRRGLPSYEEAIEEARKEGNALVSSLRVEFGD